LRRCDNQTDVDGDTMILTLEVSGNEAARLGAESRKVFRNCGGSIGRKPDNDWVLPDPYVSGRHAVVRYANGQYLLEDTSTNGVFVNSRENRVPPGQLHVLRDGDRIYIDAYEIRVSIAQDAATTQTALDAPPRHAAPSHGAQGAADPFAETGGAALGQPFLAADPFGDNAPGQSAQPAAESDPMKILGLGATPAPQAPGRTAADLAGGSVLNQHFEPPRSLEPEPPPPPPASASPPRAAGLIPDDYDPFAPDDVPRAASSPRPSPRTSTPRSSTPPPIEPVLRSGPGDGTTGAQRPSPTPPRPAPPRPSAPTSPGTGLDFERLLASAGLENVEVTPELAESFGRILRVVVQGLIDVLRAREQLKSEFRIQVTRFMQRGNNPLKFSANADDALHNLLVKHNPTYLQPVEAFEDAFEDVRNHQMAMLEGVRAAYRNILDQFNPEHLQEQFERSVGKGSLLAAAARLRYWDLYRERFRDMVRDEDATFRRLFGEEFARAYEEQLARLRNTKSKVRDS
jgi:type VI secretion system FHA domain protein